MVSETCATEEPHPMHNMYYKLELRLVKALIDKYPDQIGFNPRKAILNICF
jgi:hypothetical protein